MVATILVGMLCAHLLCFSAIFLLFSQRMQGKKMGMDVFALGNLLLGLAYALHLAEKGPSWSTVSVLNHTLTLAAPIASQPAPWPLPGAARSLPGFRRPVPIRRYPWATGRNPGQSGPAARAGAGWPRPDRARGVPTGEK